ncbi:MAG TPA: hypothetical protein VHA35_20695 [Dongiaceae bacterium]|jgi:hypothetical protein|nr:hypothetical protein [Dongiaceae bacterium]
MQKNPESSNEAENLQAAEGELPEAKLGEVSGGGSLASLLSTTGNSTALNTLQLQNSANQAAQSASNLTDAMKAFSATAGNAKNIG